MKDRAARVLVVDDDPLICASLRLVLSSEFDVVVNSRAEDAIARIEEGCSYDVILCDVMMPGLNGLDVLQRVHALSPAQAARIVFITGALPLPEVRLLIDRVPNTCLEKPLDLDGLRELIRRRARSDWQAPSCAV